MKEKKKREKIMAKLRANNKISSVLCLVFWLQRHIPSKSFDTQKQHSTALLEGPCHHARLQIKQNNTKIILKCSVLALMTLQTIHFSFIQPLAPLPHHTDAPRRAWQTLVASSSKAGSQKVFAALKLQTCTKKLHLPLGGTMLGRSFEE